MRFITVVSLFLVLCCANANAQTTQPGFVKEYNDQNKKTPLGGVEMIIRGAGSTISDAQGSFSLKFATLKPGDQVIIREIKKAGYEVFNKDALDQWYISKNNKPFIIILCRSDKFKALKDNYNKVSSDSYARQYKLEQDKLAAQFKQGKLKEQEYKNKLLDLEDEYYESLKNLDNYIDKFARIDVSELSDVEQNIIKLVQNGQITDAIKLYERMNLADKYKKLSENINERSEAIEKLSAANEADQEKKENVEGSIMNLINTYNLEGGRGNNLKIRKLLEQVANADTKNVKWQKMAGEYLMDAFADYAKAETYLKNALEGEKDSKNLTLAEIYTGLGNISLYQGKSSEALSYYEKSLQLMEDLYGNDHAEMANVYHNIAYVYSDQGQKDKAIELAEKALKIRLANPSSEPVDAELANIYSSAGLFHIYAGNIDKALTYLVEAEKIWQNSKHDDDAESLTYNNLAMAYNAKGDKDKALEYFDKALVIMRKEYKEGHPSIKVVEQNEKTIIDQIISQHPERKDELTKKYKSYFGKK